MFDRFHASPPAIHEQSISLVNDVRMELSTNSNSAAGSDSQTASFTQIDSNMVCPICLGPTSYPLETNCGHIFCGQCFITYWRMGRWTSAVSCPSCRQRVTLLLFCFSHDPSDTSAEKTEVVSSVASYNRRFSGQLSVYEYLQDLPILLRHFFNDFFTIGGLLWVIRVRILVCILLTLFYILLPSDILPESVFGFLGIVDDFFVVLLLLIHITVLYRSILADRLTW
ncbi:hypothetical protein HELRODRAFT_79604 [Helobdella robusta]|uniref:E3 ubiquitin-protein ligase RNF170 n=1 Tax=Helobdella robusta TaxID=6412 RepID=T1G3Q7_HELRO|nr:hypothetical protein HELRODRAFT_79604 [Helobdella robusta]ESO03968.1 hypothetical protein HELRODRAFT_79604 [Helobdella robusta]